jgi:hypothetical protein
MGMAISKSREDKTRTEVHFLIRRSSRRYDSIIGVKLIYERASIGHEKTGPGEFNSQDCLADFSRK